jgi:hypothetical protein
LTASTTLFEFEVPRGAVALARSIYHADVILKFI